MIIPINKKWRFHGTRFSWNVEKYKGKDKEGKERWNGQTFHSDFESAFKTYFQDRVRMATVEGAEEVKAFLAVVRKEAKKISKLFELAGRPTVADIAEKEAKGES